MSTATHAHPRQPRARWGLYRLAIRSATSFEGTVVAREVGATVLAIAVGVGWWITSIVVGIVIEVLPFLAEVQPYPYADAWTAASLVLALLVVPTTWWLLRRFADPGLRSPQM